MAESGRRTSRGGDMNNNFQRPAKVDESYKIAISKRINDFRDSEEQVLIFPKGLDNQERKYVHEMCLKLGLHSKSTGVGDNRYLTVRKPIETAAMNERLPVLTLTRACQAELETYFQGSPITDAEADYVRGRSTAPILVVGKARRATVKRRSDGTADAQVSKEAVVPPVLPSRKKLPIWSHREEIVSQIRDCDVTIVSGETGSGKSTQTIQYVLDSFPSSCIVCTQPRRLSAMALAERVAEERSGVVGKEIGYSVRFESEYSPESRCVFCTTGVALSALRDGLEQSSMFRNITHLFVDEVHERDRNTDFLLIFVKELLLAQTRKDWDRKKMKVVLMSATINVQTFFNYFAEVGLKCSTVAVAGSTFKVQPYFLEEALCCCTEFAERFHSSTVGAMSEGGEGTMEQLLRANNSKKLRCPLCGWGAQSVEDFGAHAATCQGSMGVATKHEDNQLQREPEMEDVWGSQSNSPAQVEMEDVWGDKPSELESVGDDEGPEDELMQSGVTFDTKSGKYRATLVLEGQEIDLGTFDTKDAAEERFLRAMGKWTSTVTNEAAEEDEVVLSAHESTSDVQQVLDGYLASRQGEEESEVDLDLVLALLEEIDKNQSPFVKIKSETKQDEDASAVLVFLPGWAEITSLCDALATHPRFGNERKYQVLPLHSGIPSKEQRRVFVRPPPGVRKIICATNIAETSITIEDVVYVIDCGFVKEKGYDSFTKSSSLLPHLVSKASARQRRGRAGRCRPGICFHLYSKRRYETLLENQIPELLRTPLDEMCLHAKAIIAASQASRILPAETAVADFLLKALDPPSLKSILQALQSLVALGALNNEEELTPLGTRLSAFPLEPRVGKMLLYGAYLGSLPPALTLSVANGFRDPFVLSTNPSLRARATQVRLRMASAVGDMGVSDHVAILTCIKEFIRARTDPSLDVKRFCGDNFLSYSALDSLLSMQKQVSQQVHSGERPDESGFDRSHYAALLSALICLATAPNLALFRSNKFICAAHRRIRPHQSSSVNPVKKVLDRRNPSSKTDDRFFVFEELCRNSKGCTLRVITEVNPLVLVLFGGNLNLFDASDDDSFRVEANQFRINNWARFECANGPIDALRLGVLRLRAELTLMTGLTKSKFTPSERAISDVVLRILTAQIHGIASAPRPIRAPPKSALKTGPHPGVSVTPISIQKNPHHHPITGAISPRTAPRPQAKASPANQQGVSKAASVNQQGSTGQPSPSSTRQGGAQTSSVPQQNSTKVPKRIPTCEFCEEKGHVWYRGCASFDALPEDQKAVLREVFHAHDKHHERKPRKGPTSE